MRTVCAALGLVLALGSSARADLEEAPGPLAVGAKVGVVLPQLATELGTALGGELELGYRLPALAGRLGLYLAFGYTQPKVSRTAVPDPRLPAAYDGTQTQRELVAGLGALIRFARPEAVWNGYGALGLRVYFLETLTVGDSGGADFGENTEQSTRVGGVAALGGERRLGPGALALEVQLGGSKLPHLITGDVSTTALGLMAGYRLFF